MKWAKLYASAYQYGHNVLRVPSWQLGRFAHAYADINEDEVWGLGKFSQAWFAGEFEPDSIGRYHHKRWFYETEERVA